MKTIIFDFSITDPIDPTAEFPNELFDDILNATITDTLSAILPWKMLILVGIMRKCQKDGRLNKTGRYRAELRFHRFLNYTIKLRRSI